MSLGGRLGRAVLKRIEANPEFQAQKERSERTMPVMRAAQRAAHSSLDDETARTELRESLAQDPQVIDETLNHFRQRDTYIDDRAYRLLAATATDAPVAPVSQELAELFAREEAIGRMPIERAYQRLAEIEPRLLDLERQARIVQADDDAGQRGLPKHIDQPLRRLVGAGADSDHELLHINLATSIAHHYLEFLAGDSSLDTPDTPYFNSRSRRVVFSSVLWKARRQKRDGP